MPVRYLIYKPLHLVWVVLEGDFTEQEIRADRDRLAHDPDFDPGFAQVIDLREVGQLTPPIDLLFSLARGSIFRPGVKKAIIAPEALVFGLSRMYKVLAEGLRQDVQIFHDAPEALQWLGVHIDAEAACPHQKA